jgi:TRAP-type C4-dicarboxylate transport system permease small subunit
VKRIFYFIVRLDCFVAPVIVALLFLDVILQVLSRLTPGAALSWTVEMGSMLLGALIWMGISIGIREDTHVCFTLIVSNFSQSVQKTIRFIKNLLFIVYLILLAVFTVQMMMTYLVLGRTNVMLSINMAWVRLPVLIGCGFSTLLLIVKELQMLKNRKEQ